MIEIIMWIVAGVAITGFVLNMKMNKWGYVFWFVSNIAFVTNNIYIKQYSQAGLFIFYTVMCVIGFIQWHKKEIDSKPKEKLYVAKLNKDVDKEYKRGDLCYVREKDNKIILKHMYKNKEINIEDKNNYMIMGEIRRTL